MSEATITVPAAQLELRAEGRGPDFVAEIQRRFPAVDGVHVVPLQQWYALARAHRRGAPEPTALDLATRAAFAAWRAGRAAVAGERVLVDADTYAARTAACTACEYWDGTARLGLGTCKHYACGCTKLKRWLTTERCPIAKWPN